MSEWKPKVYRPREVDIRLKTLPTKKVLERDGYQCKSCYRPVEQNTTASIHHIKPRAEGGTNTLANLITLCKRCHDSIEAEQPPIRDRKEIIGYWIYSQEQSDSFDRQLAKDTTSKDWRAWVYGGAKRPA